MNIILIIILSFIAAFCAGAIAVIDARRHIIPDVYLFPMMLCGLLLVGMDALPWISGVLDAALAAALGYGLGFVLKLVYDHMKHGQDTIGFGDIKLLAVGGIWLGTSGLSVAVITACVLGVVWAVIRKKRFVPFAPFFIVGMVGAIAWQLIINN